MAQQAFSVTRIQTTPPRTRMVSFPSLGSLLPMWSGAIEEMLVDRIADLSEG